MKKYLIYFVFLLMIIPSSLSIGIAYPGTNLQPFTYHPGEFLEVGYYASGGGEIEVAIYLGGGELVKYATFPKTVITSGDMTPFKIRFDFPNIPSKRPKPGLYALNVQVYQIAPKGGGQVATLSGAQAPLYIRVLDPDKYMELNSFTVEPKNSKLGEAIKFSLNAVNWGEKILKRVRGDISLFYGGMPIGTLETDNKEAKSNEGIILETTWNPKKKKVGEYRAVGKVNYDGKLTQEKEFIFYIGDEEIVVRNYTLMLTNDSVNRFTLDVMSRWNMPIDFSAGLDFIDKNKIFAHFKTPNEIIDPWKSKTIESFVDTRGFALGKYDLNITLYAGKKSTIYEAYVNVVEGKSNVIIQNVEKPILVTNNMTLGLIAIISILIVLNIILFITNRKKQ